MSQVHLEDEQALTFEQVTDDEVRRVVQLWAEQRTTGEQQHADPTVLAMAEGLGIPPDEALRLLRQVRSRDALAEVRRAAAVRRRRLRAGVVAAAFAVVVLALILVKLSGGRVQLPAATVDQPPVAGSYERGADGSVRFSSPEGSYEYRADGSLRITSPNGTYMRGADGSLEIRGPNGSYTRRADGSEARQGVAPTIQPPTPPPGVTLPATP